MRRHSFSHHNNIISHHFLDNSGRESDIDGDLYLLESPESPVVFRDVFSGGPGVGGGSLVFDADVPRLRAFHLQPSKYFQSTKYFL